MDVEFKIDFGNGYVLVQPPLNKDAIQLDIIFTKDKARATLQSINFEWVGETAHKINDYKDAGLKGGRGIVFGLPLKIVVCNSVIAPPATGNLEFDLMLNLSNEAARFECDKVVCPIREAGGTDWFEKETQATSFWFLSTLVAGKPGKITFSDYKKTPYLISEIPNYTQVTTISITIFIIAWQAVEIISDFTADASEISADIVESGVPVAGTPHVAPTVAHVINIIAKVAKLLITIPLIVKLAKDLQENIIQKKKYKLCMKEKDLFQKLCDYLNVGFSSTIYAQGSKYENATWMPQKIVMPILGKNIIQDHIAAAFERPEDEAINLKSYGYFDGTFSEFISKMETKYNAEARMINGSLSFEEKHFWNNKNPYQIPNTDDVGYTFNLPNPHGTNLHELAPYTRLAFQLDESDRNTVRRYRGTAVDVTIASPHPLNKYSGWGQGVIVDLGSALAKRKQYLNEVELYINALVNGVHLFVAAIILPINFIIKLINIVIDVINFLVDIINLIPGVNIDHVNHVPELENPIPLNPLVGRIGWMELSNDSFSIPKTFIGTEIIDSRGRKDWELHPQTEANMSAISLLNDFHGKNLATRGNQWLTFFNKKSAFCCSDFLQIMNSNTLRTPDNKSGKFTKMLWDLHDGIATDTEYRINETYIGGLIETIKIDGTN